MSSASCSASCELTWDLSAQVTAELARRRAALAEAMRAATEAEIGIEISTADIRRSLEQLCEDGFIEKAGQEDGVVTYRPAGGGAR